MKNLISRLSKFESFTIHDKTIYFHGTIDNKELYAQSLMAQDYNMSSDSSAELVYLLIESIAAQEEVRMKVAVRRAMEILEGQYCFVVIRDGYSKKAYCANRGMKLYLGLDYGQFVLSDKLKTVVARTQQVIGLEAGVIAEMFEDGTCLFTDKEGQRLNSEYLDVLRKENVAPENQIINILTKELNGALLNVLGTEDSISNSLSLS